MEENEEIDEIELEIQSIESIYTSFKNLGDKKFSIEFDKNGDPSEGNEGDENLIIGEFDFISKDSF